MAINDVAAWQRKGCITYREFQGHYFVSRLRTIKRENLQKLIQK